MRAKQGTPETIDEYIAGFPIEVQELMQKLRATIRKAAPRAIEKISYQIPTFRLHGNLVHFGGFKKHIGFYPGAAGTAKFKRELSAFKGAKGSVQFPYTESIPLALVTKIVKFRVKENMAKAAATTKKKYRSRVIPR
jgi:uncharacterized protein YdhG (YjbR/CyaY superfamily)